MTNLVSFTPPICSLPSPAPWLFRSKTQTHIFQRRGWKVLNSAASVNETESRGDSFPDVTFRIPVFLGMWPSTWERPRVCHLPSLFLLLQRQWPTLPHPLEMVPYHPEDDLRNQPCTADLWRWCSGRLSGWECADSAHCFGFLHWGRAQSSQKVLFDLLYLNIISKREPSL